MRPKLLAIKVSGGHLVPMILRADSRGHQARVGGHGQRDVDLASRSGPFRPYRLSRYPGFTGALAIVGAASDGMARQR